MPKASALSTAALTATKCLGTAPGDRRAVSQPRAVVALASVSWVVKVLEETMNRVEAGSAWARAA
jgi:hypothetical protein